MCHFNNRIELEVVISLFLCGRMKGKANTYMTNEVLTEIRNLLLRFLAVLHDKSQLSQEVSMKGQGSWWILTIVVLSCHSQTIKEVQVYTADEFLAGMTFGEVFLTAWNVVGRVRCLNFHFISE